MKGSYAIFQDGVEVAHSDNIITTAGAKIIASFLAGIAPGWSGAIAIGVGTTTATASDTKLALEIDREVVKARAVLFGGGSGGTHRIVVKGTLPQQVAGTIYELGIYSIAENIASASPSTVIAGMLDSTNEDWEVYDTGTSAWINIATTPDSTYNRAGSDSVNLAVSAATTKYRLNLGSSDFSMYSATDLISFGSYTITGTVSGLVIKFYTDDSNYFSYTPTVGNFAGTTGSYKINSLAKSNWTATGTPSWSDITSIGFDVTSAGTAGLAIDLIRFDDADNTNPDFVLVSRSLLSTPLAKASGSEMDIEYYLDI